MFLIKLLKKRVEVRELYPEVPLGASTRVEMSIDS